MPRLRSSTVKAQRNVIDTAFGESSVLKPSHETSGRGLIYFVRVDGFIKIGFTKNFHRRMLDYGPSAKCLAKVPGFYKDERRLHVKFRAHLAKGQEWFFPHVDIINFIDALIEKGLTQ